VFRKKERIAAGKRGVKRVNHIRTGKSPSTHRWGEAIKTRDEGWGEYLSIYAARDSEETGKSNTRSRRKTEKGGSLEKCWAPRGIDSFDVEGLGGEREKVRARALEDKRRRRKISKREDEGIPLT